jgi:hypothetical protein
MLLTFFHISDKNLGESCFLTPKENFESDGIVERVCVSPSIMGCFLAIGGVRGNHKQVEFYVYQITIDSENPALELEAPKRFVGDWEFTHEAWITQEMCFTRFGFLYRQEWGQWDGKNNRFAKKPKFFISLTKQPEYVRIKKRVEKLELEPE